MALEVKKPNTSGGGDDDNGWIKQKTVFKPKQLPWRGKLLKEKAEETELKKSTSDNDNEKRVVEKYLNETLATTPSTSSAASAGFRGDRTEKAGPTASTKVEQKQTLNIDSSKVGLKETTSSSSSSSKNNDHMAEIRKEPTAGQSSQHSQQQVPFGQRPLKSQWPPPPSLNPVINDQSQPSEESNRWSLGQSERNDIKSQLESVIGNSKRLTISNKDNDDKENDNAEDAKPAPKNINKDTLKKILELEREEQEARLQSDQTNAVIKCGLPETQRPRESENNTDIEKCIRQLNDNDPNLKEVNLNNMKRTPTGSIQRLLEACTRSTHLKKLSFVNLGLNDNALEPLLVVVETVPNLESINLETNYLTGSFLDKLFASCLKLQTVRELKVVNQSMTLGAEAEHGIMKSVCQNRGFYKVSVDLRSPEARQKVDQALIRNGELRRLKRKIEAFE